MSFEETVRLIRLPVKCNAKFEDGKTYIQALESMGIEIVEYDPNDEHELYIQVKLPKGWRTEHDGGGYWQYLLDNKGRKRGSFFKKETWYERDAFFCFKRRYDISYFKADYDKELYNQPKMIETDEMEWVPIRETTEELKDCDFNDWTISTERRYDADGEYEERIEMGFGEIIRTTYKKRKKMIPNQNYIPFNKNEEYAQPFHKDVEDCDGTILFTSDVVQTDFVWEEEKHDAFWKNKTKKENHIQQQCENWLNEHYPDWRNPLAYWD